LLQGFDYRERLVRARTVERLDVDKAGKDLEECRMDIVPQPGAFGQEETVTNFETRF
jgi:hypothetical protein